MNRIARDPPAFDRMNRIIGSYPDRKAEFAAALRAMALALITDGSTVGESRDGSVRVGIFGPLTVTFEPVPDENTVYIIQVHLPR